MKAVLVAAGFGTRTLPITKTIPKEMLPVGNKPIIQYVVEGLVGAGVKDIIAITSQQKKALEDYFDKNYELEASLKHKGKADLLDLVTAPTDLANFAFVRQKEALGTAHAILQVGPWIADEYFLVVYADAIYNPEMFVDLLKEFNKAPKSYLCVHEVPMEEAHKYGCLRLDGDRALEIVEKPKIEDVPSPFVRNGVCILHKSIFSLLRETPINPKVNEYYITDTFNMLMKQEDVRVFKTEPFLDIGNVHTWLAANVLFVEQKGKLFINNK